MKYSGRTTAYQHKRENWQEYKGEIPNCIQQTAIFEVQWSDCPVEVEDQVRKLWRDNELGNDHHYYSWDRDDRKQYPLIDKFLMSKGIEKCLIHWWW